MFCPIEPFTTTFLLTPLLFIPLSCFLSQTAGFSAATPLHRDGRACGRKAPSHPASTLSASLAGLHCTSVDAVSPSQAGPRALWLHVTLTYSKSWWCPCCDEFILWVSISPPFSPLQTSPPSRPPPRGWYMAPAQNGRLDPRHHRHSVVGVLTIQRAPSESPASEIPDGRHLTLRKAMSEERPQPDGGESCLVWLPMTARERERGCWVTNAHLTSGTSWGHSGWIAKGVFVPTKGTAGRERYLKGRSERKWATGSLYTISLQKMVKNLNLRFMILWTWVVHLHDLFWNLKKCNYFKALSCSQTPQEYYIFTAHKLKKHLN